MVLTFLLSQKLKFHCHLNTALLSVSVKVLTKRAKASKGKPFKVCSAVNVMKHNNEKVSSFGFFDITIYVIKFEMRY